MNIKSDIEAFELITTNLLKQNEKSMSSTDECAYRGYSENLKDEVMAKHELDQEDLDDDDKWSYFSDIFMDYDIQPDLKCAVGHIIPDELYNSEIESRPVDDPDIMRIIIEAYPNWNININSRTMLMRLQRIHDCSHANNWEDYFKSFTFNDDGTFLDSEPMPKLPYEKKDQND